MRLLFWLHQGFVLLYALGVITAFMLGIWLDSEKWLSTGTLGLFVGLGVGASLFIWQDIPEKPLPRAQRKALRQREAELRLERAIKDLESEVLDR